MGDRVKVRLNISFDRKQEAAGTVATWRLNSEENLQAQVCARYSAWKESTKNQVMEFMSGRMAWKIIE